MNARACRRAQRSLPAFVAGDLLAAEAVPVQQHLRGCNGCRALAGAQLRAMQALRAGVTVELPLAEDEFFDRLHADVLDQVAALPVPEPAATRPLLQRLVSVAAAMLLFALGAWFVRAGDGNRLQLGPPLHPGIGAQPVTDSIGWPALPRSLGHDGLGHGMQGRVELHDLSTAVDEQDLGPEVVEALRQFRAERRKALRAKGQ